MFRANRFIVLALLLVLPSALAGSAASPEVRDASGDAAGPLDVVSAWVTNDGNSVVFHVKVTDLSQPSPILGSSGDRYYYRLDFGLSTSADHWYAEGQIQNVDTSSTAGVSGTGAHGPMGVFVGTGFAGGSVQTQAATIGGSTTVDPASGVVSVSVTRDARIPLTSGAIVTGLKVTTYSGSTPYESQFGSQITSVTGGDRTVADTTASGLNYVVS